MPATQNVTTQRHAPIKTWIGVGGCADALAQPADAPELQQLVAEHQHETIRVLGDGANLLVHDDGVDGLVLCTARMASVEAIEPTLWRVGAGMNLPRLVLEAARAGLSGIEGLAGVPASVGGAVRMNAGGTFGQIADAVERIEVLHLATGQIKTIERDEIAFGYRASGLGQCVILHAELRFSSDTPELVRNRVKDVMAKKKASQPLGEHSAGCAFKNPLVEGQQHSAGKLIDTSGCKGMRVGGAAVSHEHANFIVTREGTTAAQVLELFARVAAQVLERCGVVLEREIVVWQRGHCDG